MNEHTRLKKGFPPRVREGTNHGRAASLRRSSVSKGDESFLAALKIRQVPLGHYGGGGRGVNRQRVTAQSLFREGRGYATRSPASLLSVFNDVSLSCGLFIHKSHVKEKSLVSVAI